MYNTNKIIYFDAMNPCPAQKIIIILVTSITKNLIYFLFKIVSVIIYKCYYLKKYYYVYNNSNYDYIAKNDLLLLLYKIF